VKLENFVIICGQYIQDTAYQFLSKLVKYCRSYDKNILVRFYAPQCSLKAETH